MGEKARASLARKDRSCFSREPSESHVFTAAQSGDVFAATARAAEQGDCSAPTSGAQAPLIAVAVLAFPTAQQ